MDQVMTGDFVVEVRSVFVVNTDTLEHAKWLATNRGIKEHVDGLTQTHRYLVSLKDCEVTTAEVFTQDSIKRLASWIRKQDRCPEEGT